MNLRIELDFRIELNLCIELGERERVGSALCFLEYRFFCAPFLDILESALEHFKDASPGGGGCR